MRGKYSIVVCFLAICLFCFTGCATIGMDIAVKENGSGTMQSTIRLNKAEYIEYLRSTHTDLGMESDVDDIINDELEQGIYTEEIIDNVPYLVIESSDETTEFDSISAFYTQIGFNSSYELTETSFLVKGSTLTQQELKNKEYLDSELSEEDIKKYLGSSYLELSVTFDYPVKETNGTIDSDNPKKVFWKYPLNSDVDKIYAYCDSSISVSGVTQGTVNREPVTLHFEGADQAVSIDGQTIANNTTFSVDGTYCILLKNEKEQKTVYFAIDRTAPELQDDSGNEVEFHGYQKKEQIIYLLDDGGGILSATLDGKSVLECDLLDNEEFLYYVKLVPSGLTDGNHTLIVSDLYGNEKTLTFKTDKTAPTVKGVKHKKVYRKAVTVKFSDKVSGIKKATLNGKSVKSGKKVDKIGKYTLLVKDKAGNQTKVRFTIKEKKVKKKKIKKTTKGTTKKNAEKKNTKK